MRKAVVLVAYTVLTAFGLNCSAFAAFNYSETYGISTRAMSMGRAFTAIADDYSALCYNPAGLAQTTRTTISVNLIQPFHNLEVKYLNSPEIDPYYRGQDMKMYDGRGYVYNDPVKGSDGDNLDIFLPVFGMSLNINRLVSAIVDIPINVQVGLVAGFPENSNSLFTTHTIGPDMPDFIAFGDQIEHLLVTFGLGLEIKKDLVYMGWSSTLGIKMVGDRPLQIYGVWLGYDPKINTIITQAESPAYIELSQRWGVLFTPFKKKMKIGFQYRESSDTVTVDFTPIRVMETNGSIPQWQLVREDIALGYFPEQLSVGLAVSVGLFTVSFDYRFQRWSDFEYTDILYNLYVIDERGQISGGYNPDSPDFEDTEQFSVGVEYELDKNISLTAGYEFRPTPVPDQSYRITNYLDMDKDIFSIGANYKLNAYTKIGAVLQYMMLKDYKVYKTGDETGYAWGWDKVGVNGRPPDLQKSYEVNGDAFVIGLSVEFSL